MNKPYFIDSKSKSATIDDPKPALSANLAAWVIIAGDRSDHDKLWVIKSGCDKAYDALINRGFTASDIFYLDPSEGTPSPYRDADTNRANIEWAIKTWAPTRGVDATHGLGIYMFDHGGTGHMCIPGTDLTNTDFNNWLNTLESTTGCDRIIIIYEACHAGSFINPVSKDNRIILTSTDIDHGAYVNPAWDWCTFSEGFWSSIIQCKTIGKAFEDAEAYVESVGDGYRQIPWIDDNHDEIGHEVDAFGNLPNGGDGDDALAYWIGTGTNCPKIYIAFWTMRFFINISSIYIPIWTVIDTDTLVERVYVRIIPPKWEPEEIVTDNEGSKLGAHTGFLLTELLDEDKDGNYTGNLYNPNIPDFWTEKGDFKVDIFAETDEGAIAKVESTSITVNDDGIAPPDTTPPTIKITNPSNDVNISGIVEVTAEGDDDQALDKMQLYIDGEIVDEEIMPSYYPYLLSYSLNTSKYILGTHNITAIAIDKANNTKSTSITANFGVEQEEKKEIIGFHINTLIISSIFGVIMVYIINLKKKKA